MIYYAVLDTNVVVSSLLSKHEDAATVKVMYKILSGEVIPVYSNEIVAEYREVLHRKKFGFDGESVDKIISAIQKFGICVEPSPSGEILPDMKDLPFYEVVLEIREEKGRLITGNLKHFPNKPFIVTAAQFLGILNGEEE
jgi:putative PIN family toxin of toxin-antitoxin system